jgi:hypothetical protein
MWDSSSCKNNSHFAIKSKYVIKRNKFPINLTQQKESLKVEYIELLQGEGEIEQ